MEATDSYAESRNDNNKYLESKPSFKPQVIKSYFASRIPSLFVSKEELRQVKWSEFFNPFSVLSEMNFRQWNYFIVGFLGWTWDAFDFFAVSLNVPAIAKDFGVSNTDVTWGITLVLMLRSVGAVIFGFWGDKWGRKWPYVINLGILIVLQIGTGFTKTFQQFLGIRAIFGIAMGGLYGTCSSTVLEDAPQSCRGILSGLFQEGYSFGYLLVVVFTRAIVYNSPKGWRSIFWFSAGPPVLFCAWRLVLPETETFKKQQLMKKQRDLENPNSKFYSFGKSSREAISHYWLTIIYTVFLMAGFNFMSHGSQDLYPTMLTEQYHFSADRSTVTNSVANLGAIFGGIVCGHLSSFIGRRLTIILACILGGAMIYPWAFIDSTAINAGAFFLQAGVQGAWGVIPIHLAELSPPMYRSFVTGVSYQLGNLCLSASSTIESTIGSRFPLGEGEDATFNYAKVMCIFMGCVFGYVILIVLAGPENRNADMSVSTSVEFNSDNAEEEEGANNHSFEKKPETQHQELN